MAVLLPSEYNEDYFNGVHPAGYTHYGRWRRVSNDFFTHDECTGEYYSDLAKYYRVNQFLEGKIVMELGCAMGYIVQWLREQGIDAWGMDVSSYAISQAETSIQPYLINANAVTKLTEYKKNDYNVIYSRFFLNCLSDADLATIIPLMNKVGFLQIHHIYNITPTSDMIYYNMKTITQMLALPFKNGTRIILDDNVQNPYIV